VIGINKIKDTAFQISGLYKIYSKKLENDIKQGDIPNHVALILDGNRRWAKRHLAMTKVGHWKGADAVENLLDWCEQLDIKIITLLDWCEQLDIKIITLYALSAENLDRNDEELEHLYELIRLRLEKLYNDPRIHKNKMRVMGIGRIELLPESIKEVLQKLDDATKGYDNHFLNIALAYGGQFELVDAVKKIGEKIKNGSLAVSDIDKKEIESNLYTSYLPQSSPDMILRTSGEKRLSGFLMWQSVYSELVFMDIFWPEFRKIDLMRAIRTFQERKRRIGK
jgi:tritrans,polycis-undecaprenyl-diphosphate synthase [geranylgeranyl-diphosphate specific]